MPVYPGFIGPAYRSQSMLADCERLVNLYPEKMESRGAKYPYALYPTPGLLTFVRASVNAVRAMFAEKARAFALFGGQLKEVFSDGTTTDRGAVLPTDVNPGQVAWNGDGGNQLFLTSGDAGHLFNLTTNVLTLNVITGAAFCGMLDGYFLALDVTTSTLKLSPLLNGLVWDPTQVTQRSTAPDPWLSMLIGLREVWLFGKTSTDVYYDAGDFPFPLKPIPGAFMKQGIAAPYSAAFLNNSAIWLAQNDDGARVVMRARGYTPFRVSDHGVEYAISRYARVDDAVGMVYQDLGHNFYVLNFPSANATWVYDDATGFWHERGTWNIATGNYDAWHPQYHMYAFNQHLVGDRNDGVIYTMDSSLGLDANSAPLRRLRRGPALTQDLQQMSFAEFQLFLEVGLGLVTGQGSDPKVMLRTSNDGGKTFGNIRTRSAGRIGEFRRRVIFRRWGQARDRVPEVTVTDPIPWRFVNALVRPRGQQAAA